MRKTRSIEKEGNVFISYEGCGCAGGLVTTVEGEIVPRTDGVGGVPQNLCYTNGFEADCNDVLAYAERFGDDKQEEQQDNTPSSTGPQEQWQNDDPTDNNDDTIYGDANGESFVTVRGGPSIESASNISSWDLRTTTAPEPVPAATPPSASGAEGKPKNCGVNPVTGDLGINGVASGVEGEVRPGVGGGGFFNSPRSKGTRIHAAVDLSFGQNTVGTKIINGPLASRDQNMHRGSIVSILGGTVTGVGYTGTAVKGKESYGNFVEIDHGGGISSYYAHLGVSSTSLLKVEDPVFGGQLIGQGGQTGNAQGQPPSEAHLHLIVRQNGKPIDPINFLNSFCPPGVSMEAPRRKR